MENMHNMPYYKFKDTIRAFKIDSVFPNTDGNWLIRPIDNSIGSIKVPETWVAYYNAKEGGYCIINNVGELVFMEAFKFERDYKLIY
jgi:hypothetical protein